MSDIKTLLLRCSVCTELTSAGSHLKEHLCTFSFTNSINFVMNPVKSNRRRAGPLVGAGRHLASFCSYMSRSTPKIKGTCSRRTHKALYVTCVTGTELALNANITQQHHLQKLIVTQLLNCGQNFSLLIFRFGLTVNRLARVYCSTKAYVRNGGTSVWIIGACSIY
jgi:hypothetical protein